MADEYAVNPGIVDKNPDVSQAMGVMPSMPEISPSGPMAASALYAAPPIERTPMRDIGNLVPKSFGPQRVRDLMMEKMKANKGAWSDPAQYYSDLHDSIMLNMTQKGIDPDSAMGKAYYNATKSQGLAEGKYLIREPDPKFFKQTDDGSFIDLRSGKKFESDAAKLMASGGIDEGSYTDQIKQWAKLPGKRGDAARKILASEQSLKNAELTEKQKTRKLEESKPMDEATVKGFVDEWELTGKTPSFGMGDAGRADRKAFNEARSKRISEKGAAEIAGIQADVKSGAMTLADVNKKMTTIMSFANTAQQSMDKVEEFSKKASIDGSPVLNKWILSGKKNVLGDPNVSELNAAMTTAIDEYAKVVTTATGGGVTSDTARREIREMLNDAQTPSQVAAVVAYLRAEIDFRRKGYEKEIERVRAGIRGAGKQQEPKQSSSTLEKLKAKHLK